MLKLADLLLGSEQELAYLEAISKGDPSRTTRMRHALSRV